MSFYVVSPPEPTAWHLDREEFSGWITRRFPGAEIVRRDESRTRSLVWAHQSLLGPVEGSLDERGQAIYLNGTLEAVVEVAVAIREIVPPDQALVLYDDSLSFTVSVAPDAATEDILHTIPSGI